KFSRAATATLGVIVVGIVSFLLIRMSQKDAAEQVAEAKMQVAQAAKEEVEDNVRQTASFALTNLAERLQDYQGRGEWDSAWNLLANTVEEVENNPKVFDKPTVKPLYWRTLEQHLRATPDAVKSIKKLDDKSVQELSISPDRFAGSLGLIGSKSGS